VAVAPEPREVLAALAERVDEVEALDASGAPLPHAALDADDEGGPVEALDDAGGDDADDTGVPALGPEDEAAGTGTLLGLGDGLDEHPLLDLAAVGVGLVEFAASVRASARFGVRRSWRPTLASSRRPAALMRGPRWKPTCPALTGPSVSRWRPP
jgi:hypothetical protein